MQLTQDSKQIKISEKAIQKAVIEWVALQPYISKYVIHIPNEGKRTWYYGKLLLKMGMKPGVSDLFIAMPKHGYGGAWIELKSAKGIVSVNQAKFMQDMNQQNYYTVTCWSIEEAINTIKWYCA